MELLGQIVSILNGSTPLEVFNLMRNFWVADLTQFCTTLQATHSSALKVHIAEDFEKKKILIHLHLYLLIIQS